jgi:hypothetical protein
MGSFAERAEPPGHNRRTALLMPSTVSLISALAIKRLK